MDHERLLGSIRRDTIEIAYATQPDVSRGIDCHENGIGTQRAGEEPSHFSGGHVNLYDPLPLLGHVECAIQSEGQVFSTVYSTGDDPGSAVGIPFEDAAATSVGVVEITLWADGNASHWRALDSGKCLHVTLGGDSVDVGVVTYVEDTIVVKCQTSGSVTIPHGEIPPEAQIIKRPVGTAAHHVSSCPIGDVEIAVGPPRQPNWNLDERPIKITCLSALVSHGHVTRPLCPQYWQFVGRCCERRKRSRFNLWAGGFCRGKTRCRQGGSRCLQRWLGRRSATPN